MKTRKRYKNTQVISQIAKEHNINPKVVTIIVSSFFTGLRKLLRKNKDISIKGFFKLKMKNSYRKTLKNKGENYNLRKRKHKKKYEKNQ